MFRSPVRTIAMSVAAAAAALLSGPVRADAVADFYKGKTVTITVGTEPDNSYDVYTRTLARHLSRHVPGNPSYSGDK